MSLTTTDNRYSDEQMRMLREAGVSRPEDLPNPMSKLLFANAAMPAASADPFGGSRLNPDPRLIEREHLDPIQKLELQRTIDAVSRGRYERREGVASKDLTDAEYLDAMKSVRRFVDAESATIIDRMIPHYEGAGI